MLKTVRNKKAVSILLENMDAGQVATRNLTPTSTVVHTPDARVASFALSYLDAFGYLKAELDKWDDITITDIVTAIRQFQSMFGLKRTNTLDVKTVRAMEAPRCGCPDIARTHNASARSFKRAVAAKLPKWKKSGVTYAIRDYLPGLSESDIRHTFRKAFGEWTRYAQLDVTETTTEFPDILITHGRGKQSNFDGAGGTLAWAYLPKENDTQLVCSFDLDETWALTPAQRGVLLYNVACHEFGHLLGLDHSRVASALMAPYYNAAIDIPQGNDDIPRLQARYGPRTPDTVPDVSPTIPKRRSVLIYTEQGLEVSIDGKLVMK